MNYKIKGKFTEKVDISCFPHLFNEENIDLIGNVSNKILPSGTSENLFLFKIQYNLISKNNPLAVNLICGCFIEFDEIVKDSLNSEKFLDDPEIIKFIDSCIERISFFIGGELPTISQTREISDD